MASRAVLDQWLVQRAAAAGAELRLGCPAQLEKVSERWGVRVDGDLIQTRHVLIACGLGRVPRELGIRNRCPEGAMVAQQWMEPLRQGLPKPGQIEMHWLRGGYIGLASPDADGCVAALAVERTAVNNQGPVESLRALNPRAAIWERLATGSDRHASSKGAAAFPWLPDRLGDGNVLLIGDAAGYAEPFSGTGIAQAMYSAECAARAVSNGGDVVKKYSREMRRHRRVVRKTLRLSALLRTRLARVLLAKRVAPLEPWLARVIERIHVRGSY